MAQSSELLRERIMAATGYKNVYLQPPPKDLLKLPYVMIQKSSANIKRADDTAYGILFRYTITRVSKKDDDGLFAKQLLENFGNCYYDRPFISEGLYHDVLFIYF